MGRIRRTNRPRMPSGRQARQQQPHARDGSEPVGGGGDGDGVGGINGLGWNGSGVVMPWQDRLNPAGVLGNLNFQRLNGGDNGSAPWNRWLDSLNEASDAVVGRGRVAREGRGTSPTRRRRVGMAGAVVKGDDGDVSLRDLFSNGRRPVELRRQRRHKRPSSSATLAAGQRAAEHGEKGASDESADQNPIGRGVRRMSFDFLMPQSDAGRQDGRRSENDVNGDRWLEFLDRVPFSKAGGSTSTATGMRKSKSEPDFLSLEKKGATGSSAGGRRLSADTDALGQRSPDLNQKHDEPYWENFRNTLKNVRLASGGTADVGTEPSLGRSQSSPHFLNELNKIKLEAPTWLQNNVSAADIGSSIRKAGERVLSLASEPERSTVAEMMQQQQQEQEEERRQQHKAASSHRGGSVSRDLAVGREPVVPATPSAAEAVPKKKPARTLSERRSFWRSIRDEGRKFTIVTTASLPWMTGTAVNPLLRAAYLALAKKKVTLLVPWVPKEDQAKIFPGGRTFETPGDQDSFMREWLRDRVGFEPDMKIKFYPGRYASEKCSILPVGDISSVISDKEADICVLEEPEHLSWYHHGRRWTDKFSHVVGIVHTNYLDYARREEGGAVKSALLKRVNQWVCRVHCDKVVKLSDAVQPLPRESTLWVHGVSPKFLDVGIKIKEAALQQQKRSGCAAREARAGAEADEPASSSTGEEGDAGPSFKKGCYFIGKAIWGKGYTELLELLQSNKVSNGRGLEMDIFGSGDDLDAIRSRAGSKGLEELVFHGSRDHADASIHDYKVFVNPSMSDVVATTTAEALAMGKFVVVADHPSNEFFKRFDNCLIFRSPEEFDAKVSYALRSTPKPLSADDVHTLSWEAATERFLDVAEVEAQPKDAVNRRVDDALAALHKSMTGNEAARIALGAGMNTKEQPKNVMDLEGRGIFGQSMFDRGNGPWSGNSKQRSTGKQKNSV